MNASKPNKHVERQKMATYTAINLVARSTPGPISPELFEVVRIVSL
jgi:hypothetical protein